MSFKTLSLQKEKNILKVFIDNPPMNLLDPAMIADLDRLGLSLQKDEETKVVIFLSSLPQFFVAHADLRMFIPGGIEPVARPTDSVLEILGRFMTLPQATMAQVEGRAVGGGVEFLLALDMVFASREKARFGLFEVALGAIPGAGGTQLLPRLMGRGRALEAILGCDEFDAETAAQYLLINRALPEDDLGDFVDCLAQRISSFPLAAIREAKFAVNAFELPLQEGLKEEARAQVRCGQALAAQPSRMEKFLKCGGQTTDFEINKMRDRLTSIFE